MNKKILSLITASALALPILAFGAGATLASMAAAVAEQVLIVGGFIVIIMWVVAGILFLTAQGDPGKLNTAKMGLFAAIGGTIIIILAGGAVDFVARSFNI